ncbi:hypothetical protein FB556_0037 [Enteractinococcus coprophilus]|uniref:Uncharacterized protein n=1 Tax=Enteractinococcus coprophilus TaxID=1027633 RepID=A0A543ALY9_9MICC|nr:hypothetical protein FB556_0037 [Enteractinococcus coprophilus]
MGDPACWLDRLCPDCSAMLDDVTSQSTVICWRCGAQIRFDDDGPTSV